MILNLGCGGSRPTDPNWINVDTLYSLFPPGVPERVQLDKEPNYKDHDITKPLWLPDGSVDAILAANVVEHLDVQETVKALKDWRRVLKPGGVLRIQVPDPCLFWQISEAGTEDWGEPNYGFQENPPKTFVEYALFFIGHKQCVSKETAFCYLKVAGFGSAVQMPFGKSNFDGLAHLDNRPKFSIFIEGIK